MKKETKVSKRDEKYWETPPQPGMVIIYTPYIHKNGRKIEHPTGGMFKFWGWPRGNREGISN